MPTEHHIEIPPADEGAIKSWRKHVARLKESEHGASALIGHWLDGGATYELPAGAIVYGLDRNPAATKEFRVRVWRVTSSGVLTVERDSRFVTNSSVCATSIRKTLRRLLDAHPVPSRLLAVGPEQVKAAPPRPNERDGKCDVCNGQVAAGNGILARDLADRLRVRHKPGGCVPIPARSTVPAKPTPKPATTASAAAPSRTNSRAQSCNRCWQLVPAGQGDLTRGGRGWVVTHRAECPPYPGGYTGPTWRISRGQPGVGYRPVPERGFSPSEVLRASLLEREHAVPADAPGRRTAREGDGWVSAVVTVIAEDAPEYIRDEDGDSPSELIGDDGWYFQAKARIATAEEAAGILAEEADRARRAELAARRRRLLDHAGTDDGTYPAEGEVSLDGAARVPTGRRASLHYVPEDQIWDDPDRDVVWYLRYNGADGDNWSASNYGSYIAHRLPRTPERAQLVADLIVEYGAQRPTEPPNSGPGAAGVEEPAAAPDQAVVADLRAAGRTREQAERAARKAAAGPPMPQLPDVGRIIIQAPTGALVTDDPELARRHLNEWPEQRRKVRAETGPRVVHVEPDAGWSYWDDGALALAEWLTIRRDGQPLASNAPIALPDAARHALGLVATARRHDIGRPVWQPLVHATSHTETGVKNGTRAVPGGEHERRMVRHTYSLADGAQYQLWQIHTHETATGRDLSDLYPTERAANAGWRSRT